LLESIYVPSPEFEAARDLVRAREDARLDRMRDRQRLSKFCLRHGTFFSGCEQLEGVGCERSAVGGAPEALSPSTVSAAVPVSRPASGSYPFSFAGSARQALAHHPARPAPAARRPDLVQRDFRAGRPNELWVADMSYVGCRRARLRRLCV
jgi:hypothetical protein